MLKRSLFLATFLGLSSLLLAGKPGEKAQGPATKSEDFSLVWGKLKSTSDVDLGDEKKSKYSLSLEGSLEVPADLDVVAVTKQFKISSMTDTAGKPVTLKPTGNLGQGQRYNAIHGGVGQVELTRIDLPIDASMIAVAKFDTDVIIAEERVTAEIPAVVMEDFKSIGSDISVRITNLQMSTGRELSVNLSFRRTGMGGAFIEKIFAVDPDRKDLGGGRWTEGDPLSMTGTLTAKFKLIGEQRHQSFRFDIVTKSKSRNLSFEVKDTFTRQPPASAPAAPTAP